MRRRPVVAAVLGLLLLGVLVVSACGGADDRRSGALLERALTRPVESADVMFELSVDAEGAPGIEEPLRLRLTGPYRSGGGRRLPSFDWDLAFSGAGQNLSAGLVSTGDNAFVTFLGNAYEVGERRVARKNRALARGSRRRPRGSFEDLGLDPRGWLGQTANEGSDTVAGADTTHLSGQVDVSRMLADLDAAKPRRGRHRDGHSAADRRRLADSVTGNRFDVWIATGDETIRRLTGEVDLKAPVGGLRVPRGDGPLGVLAQADSARIEFSIELSDVGGSQRIQAPADARPLRELGRTFDEMGRSGAMGGGAGGGAPFLLARD